MSQSQIVRTKIHVPTGSGGRRGWTKHITSVDLTLGNGYALIGDFVPDGKEIEIPVGAVIVKKRPAGSAKHGFDLGECFRVEADGSLSQLHDREYHWTNDFLSFRDFVSAQLQFAEERSTPAASADVSGSEETDPVQRALQLIGAAQDELFNLTPESPQLRAAWELLQAATGLLDN